MSSSHGDGSPEEQGPVEIEWQFDALDLRPVERWLAVLPTLALETADGATVTALARPPRRLVDSYLDTDDWRFARAGFVLRIRRRGRHDEATIKDTRPAEGSGLRHRLEVTEALPEAGLAALGNDGPVGRRIRAIAGARRLGEVLQVRTRRRPFALRVGGVDAAEVALDDTVIVVGNGQRPMQLRRVEVEVEPEWLQALEPLVEQLRSSCGLQPAHLSKFEAGLLALGQELPGSADLGSTAVTESSSMGELAFAMVRRQLTVVREKEPGTRLGEDPEELHDMRVATRRLRAALDLFAGVLPVRAQVFRAELGWIGRQLGAVRDLDVQLEGLATMEPVTTGWGADDQPRESEPLAELSALLNGEREAARAAMLGALDSVRWERLSRGLATMAQQGPARRSLATRLPAQIGLPDVIEARHTAVAKAAKRAKKSGEVTDFHRLRIRCKRLRYALEFSSEVYGGRTAPFVRQLTVLQDELGLLQDAEVASLQLADLAITATTHLSPASVFVMGGVAERHRQSVRRLLRRLPKHVSKIDGREWRALRRLLERRRGATEAARPSVHTSLRAVPPPSTLMLESDQPRSGPGPGSPAPASSPAADQSDVPGLTAWTPPSSPAGAGAGVSSGPGAGTNADVSGERAQPSPLGEADQNSADRNSADRNSADRNSADRNS